MIEKEEKGPKEIYTLKDDGQRLVIDINPGKEDVAYIKSSSFDFQKLVEEEDMRADVQEVLEEKLDLRTTGKTQVAGVFSDEFSIVLFDGSELYAGEKWSEKEEQLYP
jgi:hypothetical protein